MEGSRTSTLVHLPDELTLSIVSLLPLQDLARVERVCRRFRLLTADGCSLLWKHHCLTQYNFWQDRVHLNKLMAQRVADTDWRQMLLQRRQKDVLAQAQINHVVSTRLSRISYMHSVIRMGQDAKEVLMNNLRCSWDAEDVLARKYWSQEMLSSIRRCEALEAWASLTRGEDVPLEHVLAAYDLFIVDNPPYTLEDVSNHLDHLSALFTEQHPEYSLLPTRRKALLVAEWLRSLNFTGVGHLDYHRLPNYLFGVALFDQRHSAIPLVTVAIYSCVAQRLGLDAHPCCYPGHVHAVVLAPAEEDLDGNSPVGPSAQGQMFLDPFNHANEVSITALSAQLASMNMAHLERDEYYLAADHRALVKRSARNLINALRASQTQSDVLRNISPEARSHLGERLDFQPSALSPYHAMYAINWAFTMLHDQDDDVSRATQLDHMISACEDRFQADMLLVGDYFLPLVERDAISRNEQEFELSGRVTSLHTKYNKALGATLSMDSSLPMPKPRDGRPAAIKVRHKVGTVFRHARYGYLAMITGWDTACKQSNDWISQMRVDSLPGGREQSFYHVIADDETPRYVAEENILPVNANIAMLRRSSAGGMIIVGGGLSAHSEDPVDENEPEDQSVPGSRLMRLAGRYFKRWDDDTKMFVSNLADEYPDD